MNHGTLNQAAQNFLNAAASLSKEASKTHTPNPEYITTEEACVIAKVKRWTILRWRKQKDSNGEYVIRWIKIGESSNSLVRIDKASFIAFLESKEQHADKGKED